MNFSIFFQTFYLVFLVLIVVGPGFLTIANIAMTRGYKTGACAVIGCFLGDCILITLGAIGAKEIVDNISVSTLKILSIIAGLCFVYLSVKFWKSDISKFKNTQFDKKDGISLCLSLFVLKMSSPISIGGYGLIFASIVQSGSFIMSAICGGCFASFMANFLMISVFGTIGGKIGTKVLAKLNKCCAIFIFAFALFLFVSQMMS